MHETKITKIQRQFWREATLEWVPHVLIITSGPNKDMPTRWRHRVVTETISYTEWEEGRG
jgi:hypothetical protein